jgi:hypothetical protein
MDDCLVDILCARNGNVGPNKPVNIPYSIRYSNKNEIKNITIAYNRCKSNSQNDCFSSG